MLFLNPENSIISFRLIISSLLFLIALPSLANEPVTFNSGKYQTAVLEFFTSEGCSSCPPADRWINQLVQIPLQELDTLTLAFHVDYWDYIGWKDKFASPAYTNRQRHLARLNKQNSVYTPEFFVNGIEARGTRSVIEKIQTANRTLSTVDLELSLQQEKNTILLHLSSEFDPELNQQVRFVVFENQLSSKVKQGENAGNELHHQRVVRFLGPKIVLQPEITHSIKVNPQWNLKELGVGALIQSVDGDYIQAIYGSPANTMPE